MNTPDVYITHATAMRIWHAARLQEAARIDRSWIGADVYRPYRATHKKVLTHSAAGIASDHAALCSELGLSSSPVHVAVGSAAQRSQSKAFVSHVLNPDNLPYGSFCTLRPGLYVASPELLFLCLASILDLEDLIELGYMICGTYTFSFSQEGKSVSCPPLTSTSRLESFLNKAHAMKGLQRAKRAVQFVRNGSNSPRETQTVLLLCLPPRLHGMSCPFPELNAPLDIGEDLTLHPDCLWGPQCVIGEYYGGQHGDVAQMMRDASRSNAFVGSKYKVLTITNDDLSGIDRLISLGDLVRSTLGVRRHAWSDSQRLGIESLRRRYTDPGRTKKWERLYLTGKWE